MSEGRETDRPPKGPSRPALTWRKRAALFAALVVPLAAVAVYLGVAPEDEAPTPDREARRDARSEVVREAGRAAAEAHEHPSHSEKDPGHGEPGPRPQDLALAKNTGLAAERVARRFHSAFARYELGEVDSAVRGEIEATATSQFARELLRRPPRIPPGVEPPPPAALGTRFEFVPLRGDPSGTRIITGDLVGQVIRGGERDPISFSMVLERGRWRVAAVGR